MNEQAAPPNAEEPPSAAEGDIEIVARVALDSAEVANRSAEMAAQTANRVADAASKFDLALATHRKQMTIIMAVCAGVAVLSLVLFLAAAIQLRGRVVQINTVLGVIAKRTVELKTGLDNLGSVSERLEAFASQVEAVSQSQNRLRESMQSAIQTLEQGGARMAQSSPAAAPAVARAPEPAESAQQRALREQLIKQTAEAAQAINTQAKTLDTAIRAQTKSLASITDRVTAIEQTLAGLPDMRQDVRSILKLEQQRASSVAQAMSDRQREEQLRRERERFVQFPVQGATPPPGASGEGAPAVARP